jgi:hypothetical protein
MKKFKIVKKPATKSTTVVPSKVETIKTPPVEPKTDMSFRLIDFNVYDCVPDTNTHSSTSDNGSSSGGDDRSVGSAGSGSDYAYGSHGRGGMGGRENTDANEFRIHINTVANIIRHAKRSA